MKKKSVEQPATYFVAVKNPEDVRRNLLTTSKTIITGLAQYERFRQVRHEKLESIRKLRLDLKHTATLISKLKMHLPSLEVHVVAPKPAPMKITSPQKALVTRAPTPKKELNELERLEAELDDIEKKLGSMN